MKKLFFLISMILSLTSYNLIATDYYWVGGTGNWSDLQHWATTSGGSINPSVVPSPFDNVYFDANSFNGPAQTVTIDQTIVSCLNMDWTGALYNSILTGPAVNNLKIYGSLIFINNMNYTFQGQVYFESASTGKTITTCGKQFKNNVYFQGAGGGWTLLDDFTSTNSVYLYNGHLNTNGYNVSCNSFNSSQSNPAARTLELGSSTITLSSTSSSAMSIYNDNFTLLAGTSTIKFAASGSGLYVSTYYGTHIDFTFYNLEFVNTSGTSRIYYNYNYGNLIINKATFNCHGQLQGNFTFTDLVFSKGRTYELEALRTQTIINNLTAGGTCNLPINIRSLSNGSQANISKSTGNIIVNYVALRDINATGGATFIANNSVDVSNNTGWTINTTTPMDLYWVGGTGNWDDSLHWSTVSGGPGGACVPNVNDNVFFDANSFSGSGQIVTINTNAFCHDINWTGALYTPSFAGTNAYTLNIYGSLTFISNMNLNFQGRTNFEATVMGKTITSAGKQFNYHVYFQGAGGGWTLLDAFATSNTIYLYYGTLNTNSQNVNATSFNSSNSNPATRTLILGSSTVTLTSTSSSAWSIYNDNFTLNAGTSLIRFTGNGGGMYNSTYFGTHCDLTFYNVEFTYPTSVSRIYYNYNYGNLFFHDVMFYGNGQIQANSTFNNLTFTPAKTYEFEENRTQIILNSLNSIGTCNQPINMRSMTSGVQSRISKSIGYVTVEYVALRDMAAQGGATFTANNSVDISNNSGWIINTAPPLDLYWVGGTGNWDDPAHWSTSSGGTGGACIPTVNDNVFFDVNSFTAPAQTVTINASAFCNNMNWTGALYTPTLAGTSTYSLNIYGSLTLINAMNISLQSRINFEAVTTGKTITSAGKTFVSNIYFQGAGGGWSFNDAFSTNNSIYLVNGHLNTNNQNVSCNSFNSSQSNPVPRTLTLGASVVTLASTSSSAFSIYNDNFTLNAGTSLLIFTGNGGGLYASTYYGTHTNFNFYNILFSNTNGTSRLYYNYNYGTISFNKVEFLSNGILSCEASYDTLIFSPGRTYQLEANRTQTIVSEIFSTGLGGFPIDIRSTTSGIQGTFYKANGCVVLDFLQLRDNNATGGASWYAGINSADVANNTGWNFSTPASLSPPISINGPSSVCPSTPSLTYSVTIVGTANGFIWTITPPQAGTFSGTGSSVTLVPNPQYTGNAVIGVQIYDNCDTSAQLQLPIIIDEQVLDPLFHEGNSNICQGELTSDYSAISPNATGFIWTLDPPAAGQITGNGGASTVTWDTSYVGNAVVSVQSYNNCDTSAAVSLPVVINPSPYKPVITQTGTDLISSPAVSYEWYLNNNFIPGAVQQSYTPITSGDYFVVVYNQFHCPAYSDTVTIIISNIDKLYNDNANLTVFPNPAKNELNIKYLSNDISVLSLYIVDIKGQLIDVIFENIKLSKGVYMYKYNTTNLYNGVFLLKAVVNDKISYRKIVVSN